MRRLPLRSWRSLVAALLCCVPAAQAADGDLSIGHVEPGDDDTIQVLVSVPEGAERPPGRRQGVHRRHRARLERRAGRLRRPTRCGVPPIIAFDTSNSMGTAGPHRGAPRQAATTFLDTVPDDVYVGIVTFDADVETALAPTQDRADGPVGHRRPRARPPDPPERRRHRGRRRQAGTEGQRRHPRALRRPGHQQDPRVRGHHGHHRGRGAASTSSRWTSPAPSLAPLKAMSDAGGGSGHPRRRRRARPRPSPRRPLPSPVRSWSPPRCPTTFPAHEATVTVTAHRSTARRPRADTYAVIRGDQRAGGPDSRCHRATSPLFEVSQTVMYGGLAALGLGLLVLLVGLLVSPRQGAGLGRGPHPRLRQPAASGRRRRLGSHRSEAAPAMDQAKDAAAQHAAPEPRPRGRRSRSGSRPPARPSSRPSGCCSTAPSSSLGGLVGLLLGGGEPHPHAARPLRRAGCCPSSGCGRKQKKRLKAFNQGLADTLQLMSGSLSAGLSLAQSVDTVVREGQEPIAGEFKRVLVETRLGVPLEDALDGVARADGQQGLRAGWSWPSGSSARSAATCPSCSTTSRRRCASVTTSAGRCRRMSAEGKLSGYILGGLPPGMLALHADGAPGLRHAAVHDAAWAGRILAFAAALLGMGAFIMSRIVKVEV